MAAFTRTLTDTPELDRIAAQTKREDPLVQATIDYEIAQDDYAAMSYHMHARVEGRVALRREAAIAELLKGYLQAQIDAGVRFWIEADAAGIVNLFDEQGVAETDETLATFQRIAARVHGQVQA